MFAISPNLHFKKFRFWHRGENISNFKSTLRDTFGNFYNRFILQTLNSFPQLNSTLGGKTFLDSA